METAQSGGPLSGDRPAVTAEAFGDTPEGPATLYRLDAGGRCRIAASEFGAALVSLEAPDRNGRLANVVLGYGDAAGYAEDTASMGIVVGRYGNRIAKGRFELDGRPYELECNNGPNHLHGGPNGFGRRLWRAEVPDESAVRVRFSLTSPNGDAGHPGNLEATVTYDLGTDDSLTVTFAATCDSASVVNLAHHAYFNLAGDGSVLDHALTVHAQKFLPVDGTMIPLPETADVADSPFDFREPARLGDRVGSPHPLMVVAKGLDHCFVVDGNPGSLRPAARLHDPQSGRILDVSSTQPGVQVYTANHLGPPFEHHGAICLETQHFPDSPNRPDFPSTRIDPDRPYEETMVLRLSAED